jgi:hypothetical protein
MVRPRHRWFLLTSVVISGRPPAVPRVERRGDERDPPASATTSRWAPKPATIAKMPKAALSEPNPRQIEHLAPLVRCPLIEVRSMVFKSLALIHCGVVGAGAGLQQRTPSPSGGCAVHSWDAHKPAASTRRSTTPRQPGPVLARDVSTQCVLSASRQSGWRPFLRWIRPAGIAALVISLGIPDMPIRARAIGRTATRPDLVARVVGRNRRPAE